MNIPDFEFVESTLRQQLNISDEQVIEPDTRLREDLGMTDAKIKQLLAHLSTRMRFPFHENPADNNEWFTYGLKHDRSEDDQARDAKSCIDYGSPESVQRLYQVIFQGFMSGPSEALRLE